MTAYDRTKERALSVRLPVQIYEALLARAAQDDRTLSATIRRALRTYLDNPER